MANPFDLRGPEFLAFYVVLCLSVIPVVIFLRRRSEAPGVGAGPLTDYLKIAYLRGGAEEAIRIAIVALIDRGLIEVVDDHHVKAQSPEMPVSLSRTEQRVLESCKASTRASQLIADYSLHVTAATDCESPLMRAGLLPDETVKANRLRLMMMAGGAIGLVAGVKIAVALSRGRTNIGFLIVAALVFGYFIYRVANPLRTVAGDTMLADLQTLFLALRDRLPVISVHRTSGTNELALAAAVFGIDSLRSSAFPFRGMFEKPQPKSRQGNCGSSCGSSAGSSCGSSGSSCGSSCGGGCGGGCGGCGS